MRNHDDFIVDALLTSGGSGSPVFAVSCKTGEFELVGRESSRVAGAALGLADLVEPDPQGATPPPTPVTAAPG